MAIGAAVGLLLGGLAFLGRGERNQQDRSGDRDTPEATRLDPTETVNSPEASVIQRLTSWRGKAPVNAEAPVSPMPEQPPNGGDTEGVRHVSPAGLQEHPRISADQHVKDDGDRMSDVNHEEPKARTPATSARAGGKHK